MLPECTAVMKSNLLVLKPWPAGSVPEGYSQTIRVEVCSPLPKITLFMNKICDFTDSIYDLKK